MESSQYWAGGVTVSLDMCTAMLFMLSGVSLTLGCVCIRIKINS